jgi:hypothetical protein
MKIGRDGKPAALVDSKTAGPLTGPLKKGTVPPGNIDLSRRVHPLERDSPRFQLAAQAMRRTNRREVADTEHAPEPLMNGARPSRMAARHSTYSW